MQTVVDTQFKSPELSQPAQPANGTIAWISCSFQVPQHTMSMVRPHRNGERPSFHQEQDFTDHCIHIYVSIQVICLIEITLLIPSCTAQMRKMNMVSQPADHARQVVIRTYSVGACAKA